MAPAAMTTSPSKITRAGSRFYHIQEVETPLPSVTAILQVIGKPALIQWAAKEERTLALETAADLYEDIHGTPKMNRSAFLTTLDARMGKVRANQKILAKEAEIGSQVHAMAEWNFRRALSQKVGPEPKIQDRAQWAFMAMEDWAASVKFKPLRIEQVVWSRAHGYAGTMDLLAEINGVATLVDFKTGKAIYAEAFLQNAAYQVAYNEMGHDPQVKAGMIVRLPKVETDPAFETQPVPPVGQLFPTFLAAKQLWTWWYEGEQAYHARREAQQATAQTPPAVGPPPTLLEQAWVAVKEYRESKKKSQADVWAIITRTWPEAKKSADLDTNQVQNLLIQLKEAWEG